MTNISHINRCVLKLRCEKINSQCWCKSLQLQGLYGIANSQQLKSQPLYPSDYLRGHNILLHKNRGKGKAYENVSELEIAKKKKALSNSFTEKGGRDMTCREMALALN